MKAPLPSPALDPATTPVASPPLLHQVLTSARYGINLNLWSISQRELRLETTAHWSVRKYVLHGGKQEGVEVVEVDNGRMRFVVVPTRGMSVLKVESGDVRLGWDSPVKDVVHPKLINLEGRGGLGWLEGFNEWIVRCGLEWAGHPGRDRIRNNTGDEIELDLTLHGKIGNIPASKVEVSIEAGTPPRIHIRGLVEERMVHGPKLSLSTDVSTAVGSNSLRFEDAITNHGASDQEFQIIYHANFGPPLLGAGATLAGAIKQVKSFNSHAAKGAKGYAEYTGPQPGFVEETYCLQPLAGPDGRTELMLSNAAGDRGVSMIFPVDQLPWVTLWKNLAAEADGYVTGIEPGTGFPYTRRLEREAGRVPKLASNETRHFTIDVAIHPDRSGVEAAKQRIEKTQGDIKTTIDGG
ncbi:MAG: aldose 1-epimerase family protein [Verrucomicrobiota bacterium]|jgi:hypothetical protein